MEELRILCVCVCVCVCVCECVALGRLAGGNREDQHRVSFSLGWGGHPGFCVCVCVCECACVSVWLWEGSQEVTQETSFLGVGRAL